MAHGVTEDNLSSQLTILFKL